MLTFLEHEANIWYGSNINAAARSTYKYVVTGVSCGGTLANLSRKRFIVALLKSLSILFGIRVITVSTGTATHINEMKARHAKGSSWSQRRILQHTPCVWDSRPHCYVSTASDEYIVGNRGIGLSLIHSHFSAAIGSWWQLRIQQSSVILCSSHCNFCAWTAHML